MSCSLCDRRHYARTLCFQHYEKARRMGLLAQFPRRPLAVVPPADGVKVCRVCGQADAGFYPQRCVCRRCYRRSVLARYRARTSARPTQGELTS